MEMRAREDVKGRRFIRGTRASVSEIHSVIVTRFLQDLSFQHNAFLSYLSRIIDNEHESFSSETEAKVGDEKSPRAIWDSAFPMVEPN